jgi:serine/threonine protein phosphatase PrpC
VSGPPAIAVAELTDATTAVGDAAAATSIGPVRKENQDVFAAVRMAGGATALLVADGMGGMPHGAEAAEAGSTAVADALRGAAADRASASTAMHDANDAVGRLRDQLGGRPGTTLTVVLVAPGGRAVVAHAGDSRAYLLRDGEASPLTSDHSWVGEQVRAGALAAGSERHHPRRNVITMAVMGDPLDPEILDLQLVAGDVLVLCSDGFWEPLTDEHIAALLGTPGPLPAVVERAAQAALDAGATDNVTLLALRYRD